MFQWRIECSHVTCSGQFFSFLWPVFKKSVFTEFSYIFTWIGLVLLIIPEAYVKNYILLIFIFHVQKGIVLLFVGPEYIAYSYCQVKPKGCLEWFYVLVNF